MTSTSSENTNKETINGTVRFNDQGVEDELKKYKDKVNDSLIEDIFDIYGWDTNNEKMFYNLKKYVNDSVSKIGVCIIWNYDSDVSKVLPKDIVKNLGKSELVICRKEGKFIFKFSLNWSKAPEPMEKTKIRYLIMTNK